MLVYFNVLNTCWINSIFTVFSFWRNSLNLNTFYMCIPFCNINESFNWIFSELYFIFATLYVPWILIRNSFALKIYTFIKFNFCFFIFLMIISIAFYFFVSLLLKRNHPFKELDMSVGFIRIEARHIYVLFTALTIAYCNCLSFSRWP